MICAALLQQGWGVALKVTDGSSRAVGPALLHALRALEVVDDEDLRHLESFYCPAVLGGGVPVGRLVAEFGLHPSF